jgi:c(7)-type cytochrome triheme protein
LRAILRLRHILQLALLLSAGLLVACSTQPSVLSMIFDIPPPGKDTADAPVVRPPRRVPFLGVASLTISKQYQEMIDELAKAGPPPDWPAIFKKLPKDDDDNIDWVTALAEKLIKPGSEIDPKEPQANKVIDLDVTLATSGKPERVVVFSHQSHGNWLSCSNCHPAIFEKDAGSAKMTMDAMDEGKYCGVCHDKVAIAPDGCKGCHKIKGKKKS